MSVRNRQYPADNHVALSPRESHIEHASQLRAVRPGARVLFLHKDRMHPLRVRQKSGNVSVRGVYRAYARHHLRSRTPRVRHTHNWKLKPLAFVHAHNLHCPTRAVRARQLQLLYPLLGRQTRIYKI